MIGYRKFLELKKRGLSNNAIAGVPTDLTNEQIADVILSTARFSADEGSLQPGCEIILNEQRKGRKRNDLWVEYVARAAARGKKAYKITRFNEIATKLQIGSDVPYSVGHEPGVEGQVDWCGDKGFFIDPRLENEGILGKLLFNQGGKAFEEFQDSREKPA
ncbi:MAG: hypothetical protein WC159_10295 [Sphaerochaetaceae bacterium]